MRKNNLTDVADYLDNHRKSSTPESKRLREAVTSASKDGNYKSLNYGSSYLNLNASGVIPKLKKFNQFDLSGDFKDDFRGEPKDDFKMNSDKPFTQGRPDDGVFGEKSGEPIVVSKEEVDDFMKFLGFDPKELSAIATEMNDDDEILEPDLEEARPTSDRPLNDAFPSEDEIGRLGEEEPQYDESYGGQHQYPLDDITARRMKKWLKEVQF